ncbi:MAG: MBL fold metallo-hydrolase [Pseudomonadota bacterium]
MNIQTFHSSSTGNLYRVSDGNTRLLIEAGVTIKKIKEALDFRLDEIAACLITHSHGDHSKGAAGLMKSGIDCYATHGTWETLQLNGHRAQTIEAGKQFNIGTWKILPFKTIHNSIEPAGFLLVSDRERLLFVTDTQYIPYRFRGLTHIMIEVDYDLGIIRKHLERGAIDPEVVKGVIQNHMSLDTAKAFFMANDMSQVQEIHLLHLSSTNSDAERFKREIQQITGRPVYIGKE